MNILLLLSTDMQKLAAIIEAFPVYCIVELCVPELYQSIDLQCRAVISGTLRVHKIVSEHRLQVNYKDEKRRYVQVT